MGSVWRGWVPVGRLTRRLLSVWAAVIQGEIWLWGWRESHDSDPSDRKGVSERIQVFQCHAWGIFSRQGEGKSMLWVVSGGVYWVTSLLPTMMWTKKLGQSQSGIMLGFQQRREHVSNNLSIQSSLPLLKTLWRFPIALRIEAGLYCCPQNWCTSYVSHLCMHHTSLLSVPLMGHGHHCISNTSI